MSKEIIQNLKILKDYIQTVPDDLIHLSQYRSECGTVFCTLGHAATMPYFNRMGLEFCDTGLWVEDEKVEEIFGMDSMINCFGSVNSGGPTPMLSSGLPCTEKALAIFRLDYQINKMEQL